MPWTGIEPAISSLRVTRLTAWPPGLLQVTQGIYKFKAGWHCDLLKFGDWHNIDLSPEDTRWRNWNCTTPTEKPFSTRLIRILSYLNDDGSIVEQDTLEDCPSWMEITVQTRISQETKEKEAKAHIKQAAHLTQHTRSLLTYTDGSMLDTQVGAGLYVNPTTSQSAIEVHDAELYTPSSTPTWEPKHWPNI